LKWDDDNQLAMVQGQSSQWTRMRYDTNGDRVEKRRGDQVTHYFGPWLEDAFPGPGTTKYYWAGSTLVARRDSRGLHFYHQDQLGSTRMLTTGDGKISARYSYPPFGTGVSHAGSTSTDLQYTGQRHDENSGFVLMGARYYDPAHARFLSPDTIVPNPTFTQAANRYTYVYGNPISWSDPTGHQSECPLCEPPDDPQGSSRGEWAQYPYSYETIVTGTRQLSAPPLLSSSLTSDQLHQLVENQYWTNQYNPLSPQQKAALAAETAAEIKATAQEKASWSEKAKFHIGEFLGLNNWARSGTGEDEYGNTISTDDRIALFTTGTGKLALNAITVYEGVSMLAGGGEAGAVASIDTPYGSALQGTSEAALSARTEVEAGASLHRVGTLGKSQAGEAQFWALEHPQTPGFAGRYGIPPENVANYDFVEQARLGEGVPFITREAPAVGTNPGGGIEVVVPPGGVEFNWFSYIGPKGLQP
jgi:RHS repeat-associated protein